MRYICSVLSVPRNVRNPLSTDLLFMSAADRCYTVKSICSDALFFFFSFYLLAMRRKSSCVMVNVNISRKPIINLSHSVLRGK